MVNNSNVIENQSFHEREGCWSKCCNREKTAQAATFDLGFESVSESTKGSIISVRRRIARKYAHVNEQRSPEWSDLSNYNIPLARSDIAFKCDLAYIIDSGKHGAVYKAFFYEDYEEYSIKKEGKYVIKILNRSSPDKIKKEIKVR